MILARMMLLCGLLSGLTGREAAYRYVGDAVIQFAFADSLVGWASGPILTGGIRRTVSDTTNVGQDTLYRSMIMKTTDGGRSWSLQTVLQSDDEAVEIRAAFALDRTHAWFVAHRTASDRTFLLRTTDGQSWTMSRIADYRPHRMFFVGPLHGWMIADDEIGASHLLRTSDGGLTWSSADLNVYGTFHDLWFEGSDGYVLVNLDDDFKKLSVLRTQDGGSVWIEASSFVAEAGATLRGRRLYRMDQELVAEARLLHDDFEEYGTTIFYQSKDGFVSHQPRRIEYEKDSKTSEYLVANVQPSSGSWYALDLAPVEQYVEAGQEFQTINLIQTSDQGHTWERAGEFTQTVSNLTAAGPRLVLSHPEGQILLSEDQGQAWTVAKMDFRGIYYLPPPTFQKSDMSDAFAFGLEDEEFEKDSIYASKWESMEDSMMAMEFSAKVDVAKYKPDLKKEFAVGIDSIASTQIVFHKRVRWGARQDQWNLMTEEAKTGEIRVRKYKSIRFAGRVHAARGRQVRKVLWTSSISGDLSDRMSFTSHPRQLPAGTHFVFFKAMDDRGEWSDPTVVKVIVDDFPKYRLPFDGEWTAGGGGSYYNKGWHIRGIRYALDLNSPGNEGSDSDYGVPVRAATDGVVSFAGYMRGYGRTVRIDYEYGGHVYTTLTGHLATISVEDGERVRQGQEIGTCGSTGRSSAPHVHWELRVDGICVPPEPVFENDSTVIQSIYNGQTFLSDNRYDPPHIVTVDEPNIPGTWKEYRGYWHSYRYGPVTVRNKTIEAVWKPKLTQSGRYRVQVHIPKKFANAMATYRVVSKAGVREVKVNQNKFTDAFVDIGTYEFDRDDSVVVTLDNATGQKRGHIAFDAVRFILLEPKSGNSK